MENLTIAAISTAQGTGGIGVIRISGKNSIKIADSIFKGIKEKKLNSLKGYTGAFGHIIENNETIDEAVVTVFRNPNSYTGEDVVEISCHGGIYITNRVLRAVLNAGAKPAEPGEFTKRAFLNGKMDLTEAEAVIDIINAKSKSAARAALYVKDGVIREKIDNIKEDLILQAAHLSAWADYPEEDIDEVTEESLNKAIDKGINELQNLLNTYDIGQAVKEGIDTVIVGKPNVGKSTIMNLLSGGQRSIVTDIPGTTRDIIEETVLLGDIILRLSDTAGIRSTKDTIEKIGVEKAKKRLSTAGLVLCVFDSNSQLNEDDKEIIKSVKGLPVVGIINKTDLENKIDIEYIKENIEDIVYISAKQGQGVEELTKIVTKLTDTENFDPSQGILANERQRKAVNDGLLNIVAAKEALNMGMTFDAITINIEEAITSLLELTGESTNETVVNSIFDNFCVGK